MKNHPLSRLAVLYFLLLICLTTGCKEEEPIRMVDPEDPDTETTAPQQYGTPFAPLPATSAIQMYEVNPRVFSPAQNLRGITDRLDSIQALGINLVWLMPIYQTGSERSVGSPYAIKDFRRIHPDYGDLADLRELVDKAHGLGMAVMLDWVANHTAWDNEWIDNKSWYVQDGSGNIIIPPGTNWQDVAELNYDNAELRLEMINAMKYWVLEANVDGFRCDYATGVPQDFWQQAIDTLRNLPDRELIMFAESEDKELLGAGFDLIFGWPYYGTMLQVFAGQPATRIYEQHLAEYAGLSDHHQVLRWITNHDQHAWDNTPQALFNGTRGAVAAFVAASHLGGVPLVYNGQEVGTPQRLPFFEGTRVSINWRQNPALQAEYRQLLNFRKQSDALQNGGQTDYSDSDVLAFTRQTTTDSILVLINVRDAPTNFAVPENLTATTWLRTVDGSEFPLEERVSLLPYEYLILRN